MGLKQKNIRGENRLEDVVDIGGESLFISPFFQDLEEFVSGATDGLILFSLGSLVRPHEMPEETREAFVNVLSRLKQRVLWKWSKHMVNLPKNVKLAKWIPHQDVLGMFICDQKFLNPKIISEIMTVVVGSYFSYTQSVKAMSKIFRDQPQSPQERGVFWAEYVMRHKGAHHMRSAARQLNFFQYYCLDV